MSEMLSDELVADALVALPAWTGDRASISRSVTASGAVADELVRRVQEAAEAMEHHPDVARGDDTVTFTLSTHSAGGVTVVDIAMASVIEDLVATATGQPAQHGHHEVATEAVPDVSQPDDLTDLKSEEPMIGARSGGAGGPAVLVPSDEPGHSEPGIAAEQARPADGGNTSP